MRAAAFILAAFVSLAAHAGGAKLLIKDVPRASLSKAEAERLEEISRQPGVGAVVFLGQTNPHALSANAIEMLNGTTVHQFVGTGEDTKDGGRVWAGFSADKTERLFLTRSPVGLVGNIAVGGHEFMIRPIGYGGLHAIFVLKRIAMNDEGASVKK